MSLVESSGDYRKSLETLRDILAEQIDARPGARDLASLAQRYAEVVKQLESIPDKTQEKTPAEVIADRRKTRRAAPKKAAAKKTTAPKTPARKSRDKKTD